MDRVGAGGGEAESAERLSAEAKPAKVPAPAKPGKQPGAPGVGRTVFQANAEQAHYPDTGAGCGRLLTRWARWPTRVSGRSTCTGSDPARPGLTVWVVDHRYYEVPCACGHRTRAVAGQGGVDPAGGDRVEEWRLVGPGWRR